MNRVYNEIGDFSFTWIDRTFLRPKKQGVDWESVAVLVGLAVAVIAVLAHVFIEPKATVQAAEPALTESQICADLERYSNGAEFRSYCAGV